MLPTTREFWTLLLAAAMAVPASAAVTAVLSPSVSSPQPVGTTIVWTAIGSSSDPGTLDYRFRVRLAGGTFRTLRDFHPSATFEWTPSEREGDFEVQAIVRNKGTLEEASTNASFGLTPLATQGTAVLSATGHRLVVLYSAPSCAAGSYIRMRFGTGAEPFSATPWKECVAGITSNALISGLRPNTTYSAYHEVATQGNVVASTGQGFSTIGLPAWLPFSTLSIVKMPVATSCFAQPVVLHSNIAFQPGEITFPIATDIWGRIIWYFPRLATPEQSGATIFRPLDGGTMLLAVNDPSSPLVHQQILREIDLTGGPVRETNVERVSEQLVALGEDRITSFHHDAFRLPNGHLLALTSVERILTDVQGPGPVSVIADGLVELDLDLQVVWSWNAFDHMDTSRLATLGETCVAGQGGCPPVTLAPIANDWLHSNSVHLASDGNLVLSIRHQDWVVKVDYQNGAGTGALLWRLGEGGDFTVLSAQPSPWFSHQHDAEFDDPAVPLLSLFDNGNVRRASDADANSRGQVFWLDEARRLAFPVLNADLGSYSLALGSAERVCNGTYHFNSGVIQPDLIAQSVEIGVEGQIRGVLQSSSTAYRTFRMQTLYKP